MRAAEGRSGPNRAAKGRTASASQRWGRLDMRHDELFQLVETAHPCLPEPVPAGEAEDSDWATFVELVEDEL